MSTATSRHFSHHSKAKLTIPLHPDQVNNIGKHQIEGGGPQQSITDNKTVSENDFPRTKDIKQISKQ